MFDATTNLSGKVISVDFDGTLDTEVIQDLVLQLKQRGADIIITTRRFDDETLIHYLSHPRNLKAAIKAQTQFKSPLTSNQCIYDIADRLGIPRENINFTNMILKGEYFDNKYFELRLFPHVHIDDDIEEVENIHRKAPQIKTIPYYIPDWDLYASTIFKNIQKL